METDAFLRTTEELRNATLGIADELRLQAQSQTLRNMDQEVIDSIDRLAENKNMVLVVGEVKGGKSSFINALMGQNLLPVEDEVATSQAIMISNRNTKAFRLIFTDNSTKEISEDELARYACQKTVDENGGILMLGGKQLSHIEVDYPARFLPPNLTLVDTPGAGTLLSYHMEITQRLVPQTDAVIYVLDAYKPILQSDLNFIENILNFTPHIFFIQTKIDIIDEWETVKERNEELLKEFLGNRLSQPLQVLPISNTQLLKAGQQSNPKKAQRFLKISRFKELENELERFLFYVSGLAKTFDTLNGIKSYSNSVSAVLKGRWENLSSKNKDQIKQKLNELNNKKQLIKTNWGLEGQGTKEAISQMANYLSLCKKQFWQLFDDTGNTYTTIAAMIEEVDSLKIARGLSKTLPEEISRAFLFESDTFFKKIHAKMRNDYYELAHWLSQEIAPYSEEKKDGYSDFLEDIVRPPTIALGGGVKRSWAQSIKSSIQKSISTLFLPTIAVFRVMDNFFNSAEKMERIKRELLTITRNSLNEMRDKCQSIDPNGEQTLSPIDSYFFSLKNDWKKKLNLLLQSRGAELDEEIRRLESHVDAAKEELENELQVAVDAMKNWRGLQGSIDKYLLRCNEITQEMSGREN